MAKRHYSIPAEIGYTKELTFRLAPVSKTIMNADADWIYDDELCLDNDAANALLMPFLEEYLKRPFKARDEINIMGFSRVKELISALRETAAMLEQHYDDPAMRAFEQYIPLEVVLPPDERDLAATATRSERAKILKKNIGTVIEFYSLIADHLEDIIDRYGKKGFRHIAITSPV